MKHPDLYEAFIRISIDVDPSTKKRPSVFYDIQKELNIKISEVPTLITPGPEYVLSGADAFDWLEQVTSSKKQEELQGFNPVEMGSFSDSYSNYGSSDLYDAREQSFKFIGKPDEKIETPPETSSVSKDEFAKKQHERETFDNVNSKPNFSKQTSFNPMMNERPGFKNSRGGMSEKQKDFDNKLQQMIAERERFGQTIQRK
jgi:hypothetical protein